MNPPFLQQVAARILADHPDDLHRVLIILPSKRGSLFLQQAFVAQLKRPTLAPAVQTVLGFLTENSGYALLSPLQLLIKLYTAYQGQTNSQDGFDSFLKWGQTLLADFNEVDLYMADAKQLYNNLLDAKKIESWGVTPGSEPELMSSFLRFWGDLHSVYTAFRQQLATENAAYQGMAFRHVAENLAALDAQLGSKYSGIYLVGFNALTEAEVRVFRHLIRFHKATTLWDADAYYLNDPDQEAGFFMRKYRESWSEFAGKPFQWVHENFTSTQKNIRAISAPTRQGATQAVGRVLQDLSPENPMQTAVVLADEGLLVSMLEAVPAHFEAINITMGLPLKQTVVAQDVLAILNMHQQAERTQQNGNGYAFHHRTFLAVISSLFFKKMAGGQQVADAITKEVIEKNLVFISPKKAQTLLAAVGLAETVKAIFCKPETAVALLQIIESALAAHAERFETDQLTRETAYALHTMLQQAAALLQSLNENIANSTLFRLYQNILNEQQIDFYGEPLAGLQIMGMLETRTLDFKNVIVVGMNEGVLPRGKTQNSFIPLDLKRGFGLPTFNEKDAVFAYHFYRLLQRAENIWLVYDTDSTGIGLREKSRYIHQLENELADLPNINMPPTQHISPSIGAESLVQPPEYQKDDQLILRLRAMAEKGFSPSALATYLKNPLTFYTERLLQIKDEEDVNESPGQDVLGTVVHESLETLYTPFVGQEVEAQTLANLLPKVHETALRITENHHRGNLAEGRNLLFTEVAEKMIKAVINTDIARLKAEEKWTLYGLEKELSYTCFVPNVGFDVRFFGIADRVEQSEDNIYIADYKTGSVDSKELNAKDVAEIFSVSGKTKAFQVLFYAWLFVKNFGMPAGQLEAGIFSTRKPSMGFMRIGINKESVITEEVLAEFETELFYLVGTLFNTEIPFSAHGQLTQEETPEDE